MNMKDISTDGWTSFWSTMATYQAIGIMAAVLLVCLLGGWALGKASTAIVWASRIIGGLIAVVLLLSFSQNLGLPILDWLHAIVNVTLKAINAPII